MVSFNPSAFGPFSMDCYEKFDGDKSSMRTNLLFGALFDSENSEIFP